LYLIRTPSKLAAVYYNRGKPPHLFRIHTDVTLYGLKGQLNEINLELNHRDTQRVDGVEYRHLSTDSSGSLRFNHMILMNNDDVRTMFSIFCQYSTRRPTELDASLVRSVEEIRKSLIWPINYEDIRALLEALDEEISLDDL